MKLAHLDVRATARNCCPLLAYEQPISPVHVNILLIWIPLCTNELRILWRSIESMTNFINHIHVTEAGDFYEHAGQPLDVFFHSICVFIVVHLLLYGANAS